MLLIQYWLVSEFTSCYSYLTLIILSLSFNWHYSFQVLDGFFLEWRTVFFSYLKLCFLCTPLIAVRARNLFDPNRISHQFTSSPTLKRAVCVICLAVDKSVTSSMKSFLGDCTRTILSENCIAFKFISMINMNLYCAARRNTDIQSAPICYILSCCKHHPEKVIMKLIILSLFSGMRNCSYHFQ